MYIESYGSRNWNYDWTPPDSRTPTSNSTFMPQEGCKRSRWYLSRCTPGREYLATQDTDKEPLLSR